MVLRTFRARVSVVLPDEAVLHPPPAAVNEDGRAYLGTWGVVRDLGSDDA